MRDHEPIIALKGGKNGLGFYQRLISQIPFYLKREGWLLLEVGINQAGRVSAMIEAEGRFLKPERVRDLAGIERVVKAQKVEGG